MRGFVSGFVCGAGALYGALNVHVVQAKDGFHFALKSSLAIKDTYVDVRGFGASDWSDHPGLSEALIKSEKTDLMQSAATDAVHRSLDGLMGK